MGLIAWFKRRLGSKKQRITIDDLITLPPSRPRSGLPAATLLERVQDLQKRNAEWPEIWDALNSGGDAEIQRLLSDVRGPHMFAPHLALNMIEEGCRRALLLDSNADTTDALQAALQAGNRFTQH